MSLSIDKFKRMVRHECNSIGLDLRSLNHNWDLAYYGPIFDVQFYIDGENKSKSLPIPWEVLQRESYESAVKIFVNELAGINEDCYFFEDTAFLGRLLEGNNPYEKNPPMREFIRFNRAKFRRTDTYEDAVLSVNGSEFTFQSGEFSDVQECDSENEALFELVWAVVTLYHRNVLENLEVTENGSSEEAGQVGTGYNTASSI